METTKEKAMEFIEAGGKCVSRYGWAYRGARANVISKDVALKLLPKYSFGSGFYELSWINIDGDCCLQFNELSENDMW